VREAKVCLYTNTPDEDFIVDRAPGARRVWVAAGLSGHGFKLAPALGGALVELALTGRTERPVGFLSLDRFG
jgi:glycine/D-amino acid oxidase-like deaminating enzyme